MSIEEFAKEINDVLNVNKALIAKVDFYERVLKLVILNYNGTLEFFPANDNLEKELRSYGVSIGSGNLKLVTFKENEKGKEAIKVSDEGIEKLKSIKTEEV
jgi:hypothetical protein